MKRRRPVGLTGVRIPILLWPFVGFALVCYCVWLLCKALAELIAAYLNHRREVAGAVTDDEAEAAYRRWKADPDKPKAHTVAGRKMVGKIVDIDDLADPPF